MPGLCSAERAAFPAARPVRAPAAFPAARYRAHAETQHHDAAAAHRPRGAPPDALPRRQAEPRGGRATSPAGSAPHSAPHSPPPAHRDRPTRPTGAVPEPIRAVQPPASHRRAPVRGTIGGAPRTVREAVTMSSSEPSRPAVHVPVLLERVTELLAPACSADGAVLVDATLGLAGHSLAMLEAHPG